MSHAFTAVQLFGIQGDETQMIKDKAALKRLKERLKNKPDQINNSSLYAGSPMYFYCKVCEHLSDRLPESYVSPPKRLCKECQELLDATPGMTATTMLKIAKRE